jgi:2-oxoglutarate dehydrogenase E1 component
VFENIFETVNSGLAQALYEDFLEDPQSVPPEWRALFENGLKGEPPAAKPRKDSASGETTPQSKTDSQEDAEAFLPSGAKAADVITGPAKRLLENMESSLTIPTATSFRDIDVTELWNRRRAFNRQLDSRGLKLSFTHFIGWAIVQAARAYPSLTHVVMYHHGDPYRVVPEGVNLGLAVDVERKDGRRNLLVPVIRQADAMTFAKFHGEYERVVAGARGGKLMPDAYQGATITLTNPGTLGTVASVPRLMNNQGSIIATGAIREVAGVRMMTMTSTYDHRIIQGAESGLFLRHIDALLQGEDDFFEQVAEAFGIHARKGLETRGSVQMEVPVPRETQPSHPTDFLYHVAAAMSVVKAYRTHGYLAAQLDPLGTEPLGDPALDVEAYGLTPEVMAQVPAGVLRVYVDGQTLADALPRLRETYCGTIAYEIEHIASHEERVWLRRVIESGEHRFTLQAEDRRQLFDSLVRVDGLESFLHRAYLGHKRFGIEGLDALVPMVRRVIELVAGHGTSHVVIGMAHRGRLNVLTHVLGVPYETLLAEFEGGRKVEGTLAPRGGTGDVKYHHGAQGQYTTSGGREVAVSLMPNPSHLEAVNPVVEGYARAVQTDRDRAAGTHHAERCLPVLIHGDAAFPGQGVVAETFNLANLVGYDTGGTLHIIANNQVGFTTTPREGRSTDFASDLAKGFDVPIVHVNADDIEGCIAAVELAMMYKLRYRKDVVIDLVGYRRHGHNEGDEPRYTQPNMYGHIDNHPAVRELYGRTLVGRGVLTEDQVQAAVDAQQQTLQEVQAKLKEDVAGGREGEEPQRTPRVETTEDPDTSVARDVLERLNHQLLEVPDGFTVHPKLARQLERRKEAFGEKPAIDWAHAEALAFASILLDGIPVRLTGQDTERGTFSQRHLVLHDVETGTRHAPIQNLPEARGSMELHNGPLSEYAALGFEYGYSVQVPDGLILWEAQFGDFVNGGEVIIDQFITAGLAKWGQTSRLVLLLPHGYEGQGPEHSSARIERFLALSAEDNIRVANCSTPAQYFHLLRWEAKHPESRPLVVMTPKSLLRLPQAASRVGDLTDGRFNRVLNDRQALENPEAITRLVMCSGKVYYDITLDKRRAEAAQIAVGRVELLYPFPIDELHAVIHAYPNLQEIVWAQEEPSNFGARKWVMPQLLHAAPNGVTVRHVSRPERSSPAEGYPAAHRIEQERIVSEALT